MKSLILAGQWHGPEWYPAMFISLLQTETSCENYNSGGTFDGP